MSAVPYTDEGDGQGLGRTACKEPLVRFCHSLERQEQSPVTAHMNLTEEADDRCAYETGRNLSLIRGECSSTTVDT